MGGEKTCENQAKQVENRSERKNETRQGESVEEDNGKDVEIIIKEGKKQDKSKNEKTENTTREEVKKLGRNIEIIIKGIQLTKEDIKSLEGEYFTCTGISMGISIIEEDEKDILQ